MNEPVKCVCGRKPEVASWLGFDDRRRWWVVCPARDFHCWRGAIYFTREVAVKAWNGRMASAPEAVGRKR